MAKSLQTKPITIHPPLGGTSRKFGFQNQPPYTTIESTNFWPVDAENGRRVSATRPSLVEKDSPGEGVNMLCKVNGDGSQDPQTTFMSAVDGELFKWTGSGQEQIDTSFTPPQITSTRRVTATAYLENVIIANNGAPLWYFHGFQDVPAQRLVELTATTGEVPFDARVVATWGGRVWFAGQPETPHILYGSRVGDFRDYDYTALPEDEGAAFATIEENEGLIGEPIVALMPQTQDTMVVGCLNSMWALRGDPRRNGNLDVVSSVVGPLGQGAWTRGPNDTLFILTKTGMMTLGPEDGAVAVEISRQKIPDDLIGLDFNSEDVTINMAFDTRYNGVIICVRGDDEQAWWYDVEDGGFHEMIFEDYPITMLTFPELDSETTSGVLFGGDGYGGLARFDVDGDEEIDYDMMIGPIKISPNAAYKSLIQSIKWMFGLNSIMGGTITAWFGTDGEEAYINATTPRPEQGFETTVQDMAYNNGIMRCRLSGHALILEISGTGKLLFEGAVADFLPAGMQRQVRNWSVTPQVLAGPDQAVMFS